MDTGVSMPVHPDFARWYSAVGLGDEESRRKGRGEGVRLVAERADNPMVEVLIRLAFRSRQMASESAVKKIRGILKEADETFEMQGNDRELQILAGASLAVLMESKSESAAYAALAVSTTVLAGARKTDLPMDLSGLAEEALLRIAATNRERPDLSSHLPDDDDLDFDTIPELVRQTQSFAGVISALEMVAKTVGEAAERQSEALQAMDTFIRIQCSQLKPPYMPNAGAA